MSERNVCPSGKIRYEGRNTARRAQRAIAARRHRGRTESDVYQCQACQGFHVTSRRLHPHRHKRSA